MMNCSIFDGFQLVEFTTKSILENKPVKIKSMETRSSKNSTNKILIPFQNQKTQKNQKTNRITVLRNTTCKAKSHISSKFTPVSKIVSSSTSENQNSSSSHPRRPCGRPAKHPCFKCGQAVNTVATSLKNQKSQKISTRHPKHIYKPGVKCSTKYCKTYWHEKCFKGRTCPQIEDDFVFVDDFQN